MLEKVRKSGQAPKKVGSGCTENVGSGREPEMWDPGEYQKGRIRESTGKVGSGRVSKMWDPGEYREGKIRVSTEKGRIRASTENVGSERVLGR